MLTMWVSTVNILDNKSPPQPNPGRADMESSGKIMQTIWETHQMVPNNVWYMDQGTRPRSENYW